MLAFSQVAVTMLALLRDRTRFPLWMLTRLGRDGGLTVIESIDSPYGIAQGDVFADASAFCHDMLTTGRPRVILDTQEHTTRVPATRLPVRAYAGVPVIRGDGTLYGSLCGMAPHAATEDLLDEVPLIEAVATTLGSMLDVERRALDVQAMATAIEQASGRDPLTGLRNRLAWDEAVASAEASCLRHGHDAVIVAVDLDDLEDVNDAEGHAAGDAYLQRAARAIQTTVRDGDIAARTGGDEFLLLASPCGADQQQHIVERLWDAFAHEGVLASFGVCARSEGRSLRDAVILADARMCAAKRARAGAT